MIGARAIFLVALAAQAAPAAGDSLQMSDVFARPEPLTIRAADAPDPDVRCHSFLLAVNMIWAMSKPYGDERGIFAWSFDRSLMSGYNDTMQERVQASDYVGRYVETIATLAGGIDPTVNGQHPLYLADKAFCETFLGEIS